MFLFQIYPEPKNDGECLSNIKEFLKGCTSFRVEVSTLFEKILGYISLLWTTYLEKRRFSGSLSLHVWEDMVDISVVLWSGLSELLTEKGEEE